ncbi:MAG: hypothetical protein ACI8RZ_005657 [Myxococcota bacterium]|jgi:hypothetical protein
MKKTSAVTRASRSQRAAVSVFLFSSLVGCQETPNTGTTVATTPVTWETCDDFQMTLSQEWDNDTLPQRSSAEQSWPGQALGDFNGDGSADVLMAYGGGSSLFLGDGTGTLTIWEEATLDGAPLPRARAVAAADIDSDGDLDAFLGLYDEDTNQIFMINDGTGHFTSRTIEGSAHVPWGGSFGDLNGDGLLDLYIATYTTAHTAAPIMAGEVFGTGHGVYFQQTDGTFRREDSALPAEVDVAVSLQGALIDADLDGDLDVYMTNDFGPFLLPNRLLLNDGTGHFTVDASCTCDVAMYAMGAAVGDGNDDGAPDLFVSNIGSPKYLMNLGDGSFADATLSNGSFIAPTPENMTSWGTTFLDANLDSCMDIIVVYGRLNSDGALVMDYESGGEWTEGDEQGDLLLLGDCAGGFSRAAEDVFHNPLRSRAVAIGDLNADGRPDVIVSGKHFLNVWLGEGGCAPGLTVALDSGPGNRHGIGASVAVDLGERAVTQWMLPDTTASSSQHTLYFGFGGRSHADSVTVTWPDGATEVFETVEPGTVLNLTR